MRAALFVVLFLAGVVNRLLGALPPPPIQQAEEELRQAFLQADVPALQRLLADDWKVVHVNGREQSKAQFIEALQSGRAKFLAIAEDEQEVRDFGDTVIIIARWPNTTEFKGTRNHGQVRVTRVWMKRPEGWQAVTEQAAFIENAGAQSASPAATAEDEREILRLEKVIVEAWLKHDPVTIASITADDFEYWSFKGQRRGKADTLKLVEKSGEGATAVNDEKVRILGDTAIYTALITDSGKNEGGEPFSATTAITVVFLRRDGKWQMVQDHESLLQK